MGRVLRLQGDKTPHGILFSYTVEALVRGHDVKKLRVRNWSWPLMGKKDRVCMGVKKAGGFRLRVVPHFPSGIVERAKRERA